MSTRIPQQNVNLLPQGAYIESHFFSVFNSYLITDWLRQHRNDVKWYAPGYKKSTEDVKIDWKLLDKAIKFRKKEFELGGLSKYLRYIVTQKTVKVVPVSSDSDDSSSDSDASDDDDEVYARMKGTASKRRHPDPDDSDCEEMPKKKKKKGASTMQKKARSRKSRPSGGSKYATSDLE